MYFRRKKENAEGLIVDSCDTKRGYLNCQWVPLALRNLLSFEGFITSFQQKYGNKRKRMSKGNWGKIEHFLGFKPKFI